MIDLSLCEMQLTHLLLKQFLDQNTEMHASDRNIAEQTMMKLDLAIKGHKFREEKVNRYESSQKMEGAQGNYFRQGSQHKNGIVKITFN